MHVSESTTALVKDLMIYPMQEWSVTALILEEKRLNTWGFAIDGARGAILEEQAGRGPSWHFAHNGVADIYCWEQ